MDTAASVMSPCMHRHEAPHGSTHVPSALTRTCSPLPAIAAIFKARGPWALAIGRSRGLVDPQTPVYDPSLPSSVDTE